MPAKGRKHLGIANRIRGELANELHERHDASDFDSKTQDKVAQVG
jgi:GSH-dependent disulfide-bond oxidoreductase